MYCKAITNWSESQFCSVFLAEIQRKKMMVVYCPCFSVSSLTKAINNFLAYIMEKDSIVFKTGHFYIKITSWAAKQID